MSGPAATLVFLLVSLLSLNSQLTQVAGARSHDAGIYRHATREDVLGTSDALESEMLGHPKRECRFITCVFWDRIDRRNSGVTEDVISEDYEGPQGSVLRNLQEQKRAINTLRKLTEILKPDQQQIVTTRKRTCRLRLGGHCLTEELDKAAKQYAYLKSGKSPGRRRRETGNAAILENHDRYE
ncbi:uncharacterized protein LOC101856757 [Aplysia californica]|uniref:Uncharacterized protein LOC101856757 n=1 Tax=Aplysia californica TaxID=6500 RepID=A0ABM1A9C7_APLCA|nr:uncharacterized protein LOC101856757 [Aplysia californica]